jgi:hypothetical protein
MLNHSVFRKWVPIPKGYTNPTPSLRDRGEFGQEKIREKVLRARFQAGTPGQRLRAVFSGTGFPGQRVTDETPAPSSFTLMDRSCDTL